MNIWTLPNRVYYHFEYGETYNLTRHFRMNEFACPCSKCLFQIVSAYLVDILEEIRQKFGEVMRITSGYRCIDYQKSLTDIGYRTAVGISQHSLGNAVDIGLMHYDKNEKEELFSLLQDKFMAIGIAQNYVHVDIRSDKERQWKY